MPILELSGIKKSFGPVKALRGVSLSVETGEVHALIGENGAGKSTLMKILSGAYIPDEGQIKYQGALFNPGSPSHSRRAGIAMIYQELTLAPHLGAAENIALGMEESTLGFMKIDRAKAADCLAKLGHGSLDLERPVHSFGPAVRQVVEIARALYSGAKVIIMDEPTSSLTAADTEALFKVIAVLKSEGISVIYISHFLEEVRRIADGFTVLRDGETVASGNLRDTTLEKIVEHMVGRPLSEIYPSLPHSQGETIMEVKNLNGKKIPRDVSFSLQKGEIMGVSGLVGSGRTETLRCLFGLDKKISGEIILHDTKSFNGKHLTPRLCLLSGGLDLLSEDRKEEGLALSMPISFNITLSTLKKHSFLRFFLNLREEETNAEKWRQSLSIKCKSVSQNIGDLSGGNQQKAAIARLLNHDAGVFLFDEPTRGIDIGAKAEIYKLVLSLAASGKAVVFVSSYLPELFGVCDTLAVMHRGRLSEKRKIPEWNEKEVMRFATSGAA